MRIIPCLAALVLGAAPLCAEPLSEAERLTLIDQLDTLKDSARSSVLGRFKGARTAYKEGMASEKAAIELYLKCVEKVDFEDRDRKSSDFREWKNRRKGLLGDENYALALRQQLRWTLLTMDAAEDREKTHELADEMLEILDSIYSRPEDLRRHVGVLSQSVTGTVFTRAYELSGYKIPEWPMSPMTGGGGNNPWVKVERPFDLVIFPALKAEGNYDALRAAWQKRIKFEEIARGFWSPGSPDVENGDSPEREKFLTETKPDLVWQSEVYLFEAGDQKRAALNMLEHLRDHISHTNARDWEASFRALVVPSTEGETAG
ncbi:MAG: hypothetical protein AAGB14_01850 [Verrucomicrobiota bacterium]